MTVIPIDALADTQPSAEDLDAVAAEEKAKQATGGYEVKIKRSLWYRLGFGEPPAPEMKDEDYPDCAAGAIYIKTTTRFDWKERLRILLSGKIMIHSTLKTDVPVGNSYCAANVSTLPPNSK